jgi:hypothetical protein
VRETFNHSDAKNSVACVQNRDARFRLIVKWLEA